MRLRNYTTFALTLVGPKTNDLSGVNCRPFVPDLLSPRQGHGLFSLTHWIAFSRPTNLGELSHRQLVLACEHETGWLVEELSTLLSETRQLLTLL